MGSGFFLGGAVFARFAFAAGGGVSPGMACLSRVRASLITSASLG